MPVNQQFYFYDSIQQIYFLKGEKRYSLKKNFKLKNELNIHKWFIQKNDMQQSK